MRVVGSAPRGRHIKLVSLSGYRPPVGLVPSNCFEIQVVIVDTDNNDEIPMVDNELSGGGLYFLCVRVGDCWDENIAKLDQVNPYDDQPRIIKGTMDVVATVCRNTIV